MYASAGETAALLPEERPRYLMGVGSPEDLVECVALGVDMFDCVLPTRVARNGSLYTPDGRVNIEASRFRAMTGPLQEDCDCHACANFSAGYLSHLARSGEVLGLRLASIHNLRFVLRLMERMREAIAAGALSAFRDRFLARYAPTDEAVRRSQRRLWLASRR